MPGIGFKASIYQGGAGGFSLPAYTGSSAIFGDESKGYIELYDSGTLTLAPWVYDLHLVGGGAGGLTQSGRVGATGGGSGYTSTYSSLNLSGTYSVTVGSGGDAASPGGTSSMDSYQATGGNSSNGGSGGGGGGRKASSSNANIAGNGGSNGENGNSGNGGAAAGGTGQGSSTYDFEDLSMTLRAGGGGGGVYFTTSGTISGYGAGGSGGGGSGFMGSGTANTGGGGGGGSYTGGVSRSPGSGGSGIVIVRWGY